MIKEIISTNAPATLDQIVAFEDARRIKLPESYREFLTKNNGGEPVPAAFPISGMLDNPTGEIRAFFGLGAAVESEDIEWHLRNLNFPDKLRVFLIAYTPTGDYLCLDLSKPRPPVIFWDRKAIWGENARFAFYPVANSFEELLTSVDEYPLPE